MNTTPTGLARHLRTLVARQASGGLPDPQLLEAFLIQRSEASFTVIVERHGPMVLGVCRRVLRHTQDAEDAFQATFLVFARRAASIRKHESLGSWLHGVAHHTARRLKAKTARRAACERKRTTPQPADPMEDITWRELRGVLDEELRKLPEKYRIPLVLCYLEGMTQDEAARRLNWTKAVFRRRLEHGRDLLGRLLSRRGLTLSAALCAPLLAGVSAPAALSAALTNAIIRAGVRVALGESASQLVPGHIAALADRAVPAIFAGKFKAIVALVLATSLTASSLLAHRMLGAEAARPGIAEAVPVAAPQAPAASPRPAPSETTVTVRGRVLGPDGKPISGAKVYLWNNSTKTKAEKRVSMTTGADGRFRFQISKDDLRRPANIVATAKNHGPDWMELSKFKEGEEPALRLVKDDVPIRGRILDLEGRPVANATVRVLQLFQTDLDWWLKEMKQGRWHYSKPIDSEALDAPARATTDAEGRFQLHGLGRERLVYLEISGESIERVRCWTMTRAEKMPDLSREVEAFYNATFDHIAGPTKPIIGTVREKGTGKPLAGISVRFSGPRQWINHAVTDAQGRYRLVGIAKQRDYAIAAAGTPYFAAVKGGIADTPGFDPITVNIELERGIEIRGRVINKATGEPVRANVTYHAISDNPYLKKVSGLDQGDIADGRGLVEADGSFFVVGLPGPGYLVVLADEDDYHKVGKPADGEKVVPYVNFAPPLVHAWVRVNPSEKEPKSTRVEIALEPAKPIAGEVCGPDGKPLGGYFVTGLTGSPRHHSYETLLHENPSFRVRGLDPNRPRTILFFHPEKKLGKVQVVHDGQPAPLQVRLEALSSATGRILDAEGRPRPGLPVHARISQKPEDTERIPLYILFDGAWRQRLEVRGTTDAGGKFRLDGLVPGIQFTLEIREGEGGGTVEFLRPPDSWVVESGKTKELGDFKSKPVPREPSKK